MKAYSKYIALAAVAVSFAACQQEEMDITSQDDLVRIEATIGNLPQTRVTYAGTDFQTFFTPDDEIYVVNTLHSGSKSAATYTLYTMGDGEKFWEMSEGTLVWYSGTNNNQFNAWYPASAYSGTFTLGDQTTAEEMGKNDLMTASTGNETKPDGEDKTLTLNFNHLLTRVTVTADKWGTEIDTDNQYLTEAKIYTNTKITLNGTAYSSSETPNWIVASLIGTTDTEKKSFNAIICPGTLAKDDSNYWLRVTVNGETEPRYVKIPTTITSFDAGSHYTFNLKVGKDLVEISSVSVKEWETETINAPDAEGE